MRNYRMKIQQKIFYTLNFLVSVPFLSTWSKEPGIMDSFYLKSKEKTLNSDFADVVTLQTLIIINSFKLDGLNTFAHD